MSGLLNFSFEGKEVRFIGTFDKPEWVASDILAILYPDADKRNYGNYLATVPEKWKGHNQIMTPGGFQDMLTLFEPGLYRLINRSDSPIALPFQEWLYEEVLPSIRKQGFYSGNAQNPTQQFFPVLAERRERLEIIQLGMDLLSQLGGIDERTEVQLKGLVRDTVLADKLHSTALPGAALPATTDRLEWTLSDRVIHLGYKPQENKVLMRIGKAAASLYRARYGSDPVKKEQYVDGATRMVNLYDSETVDILDAAIKQILGELP